MSSSNARPLCRSTKPPVYTGDARRLALPINAPTKIFQFYVITWITALYLSVLVAVTVGDERVERTLKWKATRGNDLHTPVHEVPRFVQGFRPSQGTNSLLLHYRAGFVTT